MLSTSRQYLLPSIDAYLMLFLEMPATILNGKVTSTADQLFELLHVYKRENCVLLVFRHGLIRLNPAESGLIWLDPTRSDSL